MDEQRTYGIELEMMSRESLYQVRNRLEPVLTEIGHSIVAEAYSHQTDGLNRTVWVIKPDGSLRIPANERVFVHGVELVSPVLSGLEGLEIIKKVCSWLVSSRLFKITQKCGYHVHHGISDHELSDLVRLWACAEAHVMAGLPASRKRNYYCKPWSLQGASSHLYSVGTAPMRWYQARFGATTDSRYQSLNLHSFLLRSTVEFRCAAGTFEAEKVINWLLFTQSLVGRSFRFIDFRFEDFMHLREWLLAGSEGQAETTTRNYSAAQIRKLAADGNEYPCILGTHRENTASALLDEMLEAGVHMHDAIERMMHTFPKYRDRPERAAQLFGTHVAYLKKYGVRIDRTGTFYKAVRNVSNEARPVSAETRGAIDWMLSRYNQFCNVEAINLL